MRRNYTGSIVFTLLFALAAIYFLYPTFSLYSKDPIQQRIEIKNDPELRKKIVNLGLDLQGGMRLVLEVDTTGLATEEKEGLLDRAYLVIENRINALGLTEPTIQLIEQKYQIIVELPGLEDADAAEEIIGSTAKLNFHTLRDEAMTAKVVQAIDVALKGDVARAQVDTTLKDSVEVTGDVDTVAAIMDDSSSESSLDDELFAFAAEDGAEENVSEFTTRLFSEYVQQYGNVFYVRDQDKDAVTALLEDEKVLNAIKSAAPGSMLAWSHKPNNDAWALYLLKTRQEMSGENVKTAFMTTQSGDFGGGAPAVSLSFNNEGARDFSNTTRRNIGKQLAIVLDNTVYSAPNINERIPTGNAQISGSFTRQEAEQLAIVLQAGALPADVKIGNKKIIGPSLGKESIDKAVIAAIIGFGLVLIFMVVYYKLSGVLAVFALFLNILFVLSLLSAFGATLTLPGIAGLILTMGMSIDANVIIFERIKEELKLGKGIMSSIEAGYDRAFVTIMDANVTTLFTAIILFYLGSGPIRGFAITMMFGIIVSLFTALTFTRMVFHFAVSNSKVKKLSI